MCTTAVEKCIIRNIWIIKYINREEDFAQTRIRHVIVHPFKQFNRYYLLFILQSQRVVWFSCCDAGLWKVEVVTGDCQPQDSDDSQKQVKPATEDSQRESDLTGQQPDTQVKPADEVERRDNGDDAQAQQQMQQPQDNSSKEDADNINEEQVKEHEAPNEGHCRRVMVLYGDQGKTQPLFFGDRESISPIKFQPGVTDKFIVS